MSEQKFVQFGIVRTKDKSSGGVNQVASTR
jgi:hypothetical protein